MDPEAVNGRERHAYATRALLHQHLQLNPLPDWFTEQDPKEPTP